MRIYNLVVFALVFVGLWIVQFKKNLKEPFAPKSSQNTTDNNLKEDNQADLRLIDTDKDSLSDWDELNIYKTSPYLEDTDSDGILDRDEIKNGENPNQRVLARTHLCFSQGDSKPSPRGAFENPTRRGFGERLILQGAGWP